MSETKINHLEMRDWIDNLTSEQRNAFFKRKHETESAIIIKSNINIIPEIIGMTIINSIVNDVAAYHARGIELDEPMHLYLENKMNIHKYSNFDVKVDYRVKGIEVTIDSIEIKFNHDCVDSECCSKKTNI